MFISKLNSSGDFIWAKKVGGAVGGEQGRSIYVDSSNNVYVTGIFYGTVDFDPGPGTSNLSVTGFSQDIFILKLDSNGDFVWAKKLGGSSDEDAYSVTADSSGNVYTTGRFLDIGNMDFDPGAGTYNLTSNSYDVFISKLDVNGDFVWAKAMNGTGSYEYGRSIKVDTSSNVFITGAFEGTTDFDPGVGTSNLISLGGADVFISKLDVNGDLVWAKSFGGTNANDFGEPADLGRSINLDSSNNVYVTGSFKGSNVDFDPGAGTYLLSASSQSDIFISKVDSNGDFVWAKRVGGTGDDISYSSILDSSNNIYYTGSFNSNGFNTDFDPGAGTYNLTSPNGDIFISKLDSNGDFVWAKSVTSITSDIGYSIGVSSNDYVYVVGELNGSSLVFKLIPDVVSPTLSETTPIGVVVNNGTISYTFTTNEAGTITYGGSCSSATTVATVGSNTITLNPLSPGNYTDCTITVTDASSNASTPLSISSFDIVVHSGGGGGGSTPTSTEPTPVTPETLTTPEPTPQPETITPVIPTEPIIPPIVCNQGELYNANTGEACTSFIPIPPPVVVETPKPIVKPKPIITETKTENIIPETKTEVLPPPTTQETIPTITETIPTQESTNNTVSNTEPTLEEKYGDLPLYSTTAEEEIKSESILTYIDRQARESFKETINIANQGKEKIKEILATKEGNITSKAVTIGGVVAGTSGMVASIAFATPLSFSEIPLIPLRMWTLFLGFLGIKKRTRRWGVVYDSITKQPLDPAYVTLKNLEGQTVATTITDIDGRYGFVVDKGMYTIAVNKTNYTFPSLKLANKQTDELYDSLYLGDSINVSTPDEVITKNIPLDPVNFSWNETEKAKKGLTTSFNNHDLLISRITNFLFILGFLIALIALLVAPEPYNGIILALYLTIFILKKVGIQTKNKGSVIEKATGLPLSNGIIRLFYTDIGQEIAHAIIDKSGKFYCLVQNGTYKVQIEKKNLDGSYTPVYQQSLVTVTNGVLNVGFRV